MKKEINKKIIFNQNTLYIEPITSCNLKCKLCYAKVINGNACRYLDKEKLIKFIDNWIANIVDMTNPNLYWCGTGEVFLYRDFPDIVNIISNKYKNIKHTIQTNGTLDRINEFNYLDNIDFRVSVDGTETYHDWNRGQGNFNKTINICKNIINSGFRLNIRMLLTIDNILCLDDFRSYIDTVLNNNVSLSFIVPYNKTKLGNISSKCISESNMNNYSDKCISETEVKNILKTIFNNRYLLDDESNIENYLSINTYGVYNCCEGIIRIGDIDDDINILVNKAKNAISSCYKCGLYPCV